MCTAGTRLSARVHCTTVLGVDLNRSMQEVVMISRSVLQFLVMQTHTYLTEDTSGHGDNYDYDHTSIVPVVLQLYL